MCAGAENGEKCGDGAGVAERAQTGEGSWNTCIAKVWWHLFVKWPEKKAAALVSVFFFPLFWFPCQRSEARTAVEDQKQILPVGGQWLCCFENDLFPFMIFGRS